MGIPDHLICLLRNLYAGQEATVRTGHGTIDWFQIGKGVHQGCILSPCLVNLYAEYIMRNVGLEETQAGIKIAKRNSNNLRYADDTNLMAESEELKSLFISRPSTCTRHAGFSHVYREAQKHVKRCSRTRLRSSSTVAIQINSATGNINSELNTMKVQK